MADDNILIQRLLTVFGRPDRTDDIPGFLEEYRKLLSGFGPNTLDAAATHLIRNGGKYWPAPKVCVEACIDVVEMEAGRAAANRANQPQPKMPWEVAAEKGRAWATDYIKRSDLGRQAQVEFWSRELELYAYSYARSCYQLGGEPKDVLKWRPDAEAIATYRKPFLRSQQAAA